jgi:polyvinyl alcohol dehydrogenase (cytochrome)
MTRLPLSRFAAAAAAAAVVAGLAACGSAGPGGQSTGPAPSTRTIPASSAASGGGSGGAGGTPGAGAAYPAAAWGQFGNSPAKSGVATGLPAAGHLSVAWRAALDGAVYGQPLVIGQLVIAATENDSLYGLNETTGRVAWRTHLGSPVRLSDLPCGNIDPLGITGTPAYDRDNGLVYALAETAGYRHVLFGLSVSSGTVQVERDIPAPDGQPRYDQQRPALTIEDGRVYIAFGGLYGDCGPYVGSVVGVPASGAGALLSYRVPTAKGGAIWGTAGPVAGPGGTLYVSSGNGAADGGAFDGSDSVTALSPGLTQTGIFAPVTWGQDNANDLDLGSTQPALLPGGTLLAVGKRGTGYLLRASHLGGVGGQIASGSVCKAFGAAAVSGTTVYEPCESSGMTAVSTAGNHLRVLWTGPAGASGSPVLGGGAVWVNNWDSGTLYELNPANGTVRDSVSLGATLPHFASLSLAGSLAFVGTDDGVTAVRGA